MSEDARAFIREEALKHGFCAVGFAPATQSRQVKQALTEFLSAGYHGDMGWMEARANQRSDPCTLWPEARTAIVLGMSYLPDQDPQGKDYHDVIKPRLKTIARALSSKFACDLKVFVDTAPVMEKPLGQTASIGWQGKHTNLVSSVHGSWLFLGVILTTLELPIGSGESDHCGSCRRCLDACPTNAFPEAYKLDARRCISYLTIEHKGPIPVELRPMMGNRIYGCDDCLAVCPWNKFAHVAREIALAPTEAVSDLSLASLLQLGDADFRLRFKGSPIKRIGRDRFIRNVLMAAGNSGNHELVRAVQPLLSDPSPLVRGAAIWALSRLMQPNDFVSLREVNLPHEPDGSVVAEWGPL
jgi:epoxyqueuosine reductase